MQISSWFFSPFNTIYSASDFSKTGVYALLWVNRTSFKLKLGTNAFSTLSLRKMRFLSFWATTFWTHLLFICCVFASKEELLQIWGHSTFSVIASCCNRELHLRRDLCLLFSYEWNVEVYLLPLFYLLLSVFKVLFQLFDQSFNFKVHITAIYGKIVSFRNERTTWIRNSSL